MLNAFAQNPKLVCLSGPLVYYDLSRLQRLGVTMFYWLAKTLYALNRYILHMGSMVQGGNFILRRDALEKIGGFNTAIAFYGEDTDIARRALSHGRRRLHLKLQDLHLRPPPAPRGRRLPWAAATPSTTLDHVPSKPFSEKYLDIREGADGKLSSEEK